MSGIPYPIIKIMHFYAWRTQLNVFLPVTRVGFCFEKPTQCLHCQDGLESIVLHFKCQFCKKKNVLFAYIGILYWMGTEKRIRIRKCCELDSNTHQPKHQYVFILFLYYFLVL